MTAGVLRETIIIGSVVVYILLTSVLAYVLRGHTTAQFMVGSKTRPAVVIAVLPMSKFIGAKSTVDTAQEGFEKSMAAGWSVLVAALAPALVLATDHLIPGRRAARAQAAGAPDQ
jgi:SSS family solute:Na+ symporter